MKKIVKKMVISTLLVALLVGTRGSGKSHTLGVLVESLATTDDKTSIGEHSRRQGLLLLDPMGNFWTTLHKVRPDGRAKVKAQYASLDGWGCQPEDVDAQVWMPAGFRATTDPAEIREFRVRVSDLDDADIADLIGVNLMKDPQGAALAEAFDAVTREGWHDDQGPVAPTNDFTFDSLVRYLERLRDDGGGDHALSTLRALVRSLRALARQPTFSGEGTPLTALLEAGKLNILMLPLRVGKDLRRVITRLLITRILREREQASQIQQRLDIEEMEASAREALESELAAQIPRSILAIDEAQELLGESAGEAREALEDFCLLGRNYGLSLILATQRPTASAISSKVRSQVAVYLIHKLLTQDDIEISRGNLLAVYPKEVLAGDRELDFAQLVRSLDSGQVIVAASHAVADDTIDRLMIATVRPRITVHGGEIG